MKETTLPQVAESPAATGLIKIEELAELGNNASLALALNRASADKAAGVAREIIVEIERTAIADTPACRHLDETCKDFLSKASITVKTMKERREGVTRFFDEIRKVYTGLENRLAPASPDVSRVKKYRDDFAAYLVEEERKREKERQRVIAAANERVEIEAATRKAIAAIVRERSERDTAAIAAIFGALTLDNVEQTREKLQAVANGDTPALGDIPVPLPDPVYISVEDRDEIVLSVLAVEEANAAGDHAIAVVDAAGYYLDRVDSRVRELQEIAAASDAERERLAAVAAEREKREQEALATAAARAESERAAVAEAVKAEQSVMNIFDAPLAPVVDVKKAFKLRVTNNAGYAHVFMFWYEREGRNLSPEKFEKKSVGQMVKFCEDAANKSGDRVSSPNVEYGEEITAKK
jgi:hypothetical protein